MPNDIRMGEYYWFVADDGDIKEGKVISSFRKGFCVLSAFDGTGTYKIQSPDSLFETDKDCRKENKKKSC